MSRRVNLLLLLSALLSALTGVSAAARAPEVQAVATQRQADVVVARRVAVMRPVQALPTPMARLAAPVAKAWSLVPAAPLYASRRRE